MRAIINFILLIIIVAVFMGWFDEKRFIGPKTYNFSKGKFNNIEAIKDEKGVFDLLKWLFTRKPAKWPKFIDSAYGDKPESIINNDKQMRVTFINHASFLVQTAGYNMIFDPIYSDTAGPWLLGPKRVRNPGIKFDDLPKIDVLFISHNHFDHLDLDTIKRIYERDNPYIIAPLGVISSYIEPKIGSCDKCKELDWWLSYKVHKDLIVQLTPAQHWSSRNLFDKNSTLWGGFLITTNAGNIYFAGDTGLGSGKVFEMIKEEASNIRLALLPIGAYSPSWFMQGVHVNPEEAVQIHKILNPTTSIGMHYGTFQLSDKDVNEPVERLNKAVKANSINNFITLGFGEKLDIK